MLIRRLDPYPPTYPWLLLVLLICSAAVTSMISPHSLFLFFFNDTATTEIYTLSLHDALPICEALELAARSFLAGRRCCDMLWGLEATGCMVDRAISNGAEVEVELPSENKAQRPLLVRVIPQNKDQQQDLATGCIVIVRDVSELRQAEEEGSKNRAFLASLADLAPDEIYTLDTERRFTWMNQRAEVDSGLTRSVLLVQDFSIIVAAESEEEAKAAVECTLGGEEKQFELVTICTDGRVRCMDAHTSPLWSDGNITGVMVFMSYITERKLAQARAARSDKLRALGELAAGVAHNLNNSLTVIQG